MAKIYGQLEAAQHENLAADPASTATGYVYFNTVSLFIKHYNGAAWKTLVETNSAQVLTLKDYDGGTATNTSRVTLPKETLVNLTALARKQATIAYDTANSQVVYDDGANLIALASASTALNEFNIQVGNSSNVLQSVNTDLLGSSKAVTVIQDFVDGDVNTGADTIAITSHGLVGGDTVYFTNAGGSLPGGITANTTYYVVFVDANTFKIAASLGDVIAASPVPVDITSAAGGGTHSVYSGGISVKDFNLPGSLDGAAAASGYVGEKIESIIPSGSAVVIPSNTPTNITSVNLPKGNWLVYGHAIINGTLTGSGWLLSISDSNSTNGTSGDNRIENPTLPTSVSGATLGLQKEFYLNATANIYLVADVVYSVGSCTGFGRLTARRLLR